VPKMITIGSVGFSINVKYTVTKSVYLFFILRQAYSPNGNSSIDADFLKEVPFGGLDICKEIFRVIFAPKMEKHLNHCTNMKFLKNFLTEQDEWKILAK
jgi:hypothetical protein